MHRIPDAERHRIEAAVHAAEAKTRAEFVLVIARRADPYFFPTTIAATSIALLLPGALWYAGLAYEFPHLYAVQLVAFVVLFFLFRLPDVVRHLVPREVRTARARRLARELFYRLGMHRTRERSGVLLFVSLGERYVEIIADDAVDKAVPPETWQNIVASFTTTVRSRGAVAGFLTALQSLGDALGGVLPRRPDDRNELPDRLIEL